MSTRDREVRAPTPGDEVPPVPDAGRAGAVPGAVVAAVVVAAVVAVAVVVAVVLARGAAPFTAIGVSEPGPAIRVAAVSARALALVAGGLGLGGVVAAVAVVPGRGGARELSAPAYAAVRAAGAAAAVWALAASAAVPLTVLAGTGGDPGVLREAGFAAAMGALQEPAGFLVAAVAAAVVAVMCRVTLSWRAAAAAVPLAVLATVAPVVTGFAASIGADHDVVTDLSVLAALAVAVGLGVTATAATALGARRVRREPDATLVTDRARRIVRVAVVVAVVTTLLADRWLVAGAWTGRYGLLALAQLGLLLVAAVAVLVPTGAARPAIRPALRWGLAIGGLGSALVVTALLGTDTPPGLGRPATPTQTLLGFDLPGPVSALRLAGPGRVEVLLDLGVVLLAAGYLAALRRLRRRGDAWPSGRTAAWLGGCALTLWAVSGGTGEYAMAMFSVHMGAHMLLSMLVPVLLVLGGPVTLALRALPAGSDGEPDGPRTWLLSLTHSPAARVLTNPLVSTVLFVGSYYALYFTPIFSAALAYHWAHELMYLHFVVVGYLFFWPIVGVDRAPRPLPHIARLGLLLASMPFHVFFGITLMSSRTVIGSQWYGDLALPWVHDLLADQTLGGGIAWAAGEAPLLVVVIALLVQWSRHDERLAARHDRQAERDDDAELAAWNRMLGEMAERRR